MKCEKKKTSANMNFVSQETFLIVIDLYVSFGSDIIYPLF